MDEAARNEILHRFNATQSTFRRDVRLDQIFEEQVQRAPDRVALVEGELKITYRDLNAKADMLARLLVSRGLTQDRPAGIYMERSIDAVAAVIAALKANAPFVPLDIGNPQHRLAFMIRDSGSGAILTHRGLGRALPNGFDVVNVDEPIGGDGGDCNRTDLPANRSPDELAYIIYTSGSTGVPKGVEGSHRALVNRFEWMWRAYPFSIDEMCCQKTPLGFVDAVWEILGPLLGGVCSVIVPENSLHDLDQFVALLSRHKVTRIVLVPSLLRFLLDGIPDLTARLPDLKLWTASGEVLPLDLARQFRAALPSARLLNLYGSSEVTADVTCHEVEGTEGLASVPIGRPISNVQVFILDERKNLVAPLVAGEIHVAGTCLARGYWKNKELTSERFFTNPHTADFSRLMFATGDRGRFLSDGRLEYIGRLDAQIKLRGMRIEPGEIESNLAAYPMVRGVAVGVYGDSPETRRLIAYVMRSERAGPLAEELRGFLRARLPDHMIPAEYIELDRMPLLPSGKVDRGALPIPMGRRGLTRSAAGGQSDIEKKLISIWMEVLEVDEIGIDDDFFDIGGHSLSGIRVLSRIRRDFQVDVPIRILFDRSTIRELALEIEQRKVDQAVPTRVPAISGSLLLDTLRAELSALPPEQVDAFLRSIGVGHQAKPSGLD
jgi:amino acid adenylation domain-containing protein